jgi:putative transposase
MKYSPDEKYEIIRMVEQSDLGVKRTLKKIGIPKSSFYLWYHQYLEHGIDGLKPLSRRPRRVWNQISAEHRQAILDLALIHPELSSREIAVKYTDDRRYFVSESSVYRILKAKGLITTPAYALQLAKDEFQDKTTRINQMWQTDFTYCRVIGWGMYYLSTIMDDYSRKIVAWQLCSSMTAEDVKSTIDLAIINTGMMARTIVPRPRLLSDNGPCYVSGELADYLDELEMDHIRGAPYHPQTQGKIERYHRSLKNILLLDNYYSPSELEAKIGQWVEYYNNRRYHETLGNITPSDMYEGKRNAIMKRRMEVKRRTIRLRRKANGFMVKEAAALGPAWK